MRKAVIVGAVRTPVGKCRGSLASVEAYKLGSLVVKEVIKRSGILPEVIDEVIFGNLMGHDINNMARMVSLDAGIPIETPAFTIDRQCSTSANAVALASIMIQAGEADVILAGGVESDSRRPYIMLKQEIPYSNTPPRFCEAVRASPDSIGNPNMGITAENLAVKYSLSREECDEFAFISHKKALNALGKGYFNSQIVSVDIDLGKGKKAIFSEDEIVRKNISMERLGVLKPAFKVDGIVTAGNSSPMSDGAAAVIVMEEEKAKSLGLEILARYRGFASAGCDPNIMGIGPVPATRKLLNKTGINFKDIDLIEMNEAFAAQSIPCIRELGIDMDRLNVNGGAIALGHPLAATGAVLITKIIYEMKRRDSHLGMVTFCCGGGQGIALLLER